VTGTAGAGPESPQRAARRALGLRGALLPLLLPVLAACDSPLRGEGAREAAAITGGDPALAPALMRTYGCAACHTIPGVDGANALVGPPLTHMASRAYIGGVLPNAPDNMMRWIRDPRGVDSLTAMPNTGVTESDARHIAAYLYTLR
jgi:cytochrome c1